MTPRLGAASELLGNPLESKYTKLRVREQYVPGSPILGTGTDVTAFPEGHLCCSKCHGYKFECWVFPGTHKIELGCMTCGDSSRLALPLDVDIPHKEGRFTCLRTKVQLPYIANGTQFSGEKYACDHTQKGMIIIHTSGTLCIGCEACNTEMRIILTKTDTNLVLA